MRVPEQFFDRLPNHEVYQVAVLGHLNDYHFLRADPVLLDSYSIEVFDPRIFAICESDEPLKTILPQFKVNTNTGHQLLRLKQFMAPNPNFAHDFDQFHYPDILHLANPTEIEVWGHDEIKAYGPDDGRSHMPMRMFFGLQRRNVDSMRELLVDQPIKLHYVVYPRTCTDGSVHMFGLFDHLELKSINDTKALQQALRK